MSPRTRVLLLLAVGLFVACGDDSPSSPSGPDPEPEVTRQPEALACAPLPERAIAWYPAEGTAEDVIGDADGTLEGGARYTTGYVGEAFDLGGGGAVVRLDEARGSSAFSIEGWLKLTATPTGRRAIYGTFLSGLYLRNGRLTWWQDDNARLGPFGTDSGLTPVVCTGENRCDRFVGAAPIDGGEWTHVALTYDGSEFRSYVDGEVDRVESFVGGIMQGTGASPGVGLWARSDFPFWFVGLIDELTVYNRALSAGEVEGIWNAGFRGKCVA